MAGSVKCICSLRVSAVHAPVGVSVVDGGGETPGPFPNPEAKPARADGTAPGREWESRLPPTQQLHTQTPVDETKPSFIYGCFHVYPHDCCRRQQQHWCPPTSPQYGAGTVRASLCHCIVGVHPLVRNAESGTVRASLCRRIVVAAPPIFHNAESETLRA